MSSIRIAFKSSILKTLNDRITERESNPSAEQNMEKNAWESFWMLLGPELLLYASSCGSVDSVKLLVNMKCLQHYERYNVDTTNNIKNYIILLSVCQ